SGPGRADYQLSCGSRDSLPASIKANQVHPERPQSDATRREQIAQESMALFMRNDAGRADGTLTSAAMGASEDPLRAIAEAIPGIILIFDADGLCSYVSRRWFEYTG